MNHAPSTPGSAGAGFAAGPWVHARTQAQAATDTPSAQDRAFIALQDAYRPHGGLSRLQSLVGNGRLHADGQGLDVAALVDAGALFGFDWHDDFWVPMFQFDLSVPALATGPQRVRVELGRGFEGWPLASWFVQPSRRLAGLSPIQCLQTRLGDVLAAARADRLGR